MEERGTRSAIRECPPRIALRSRFAPSGLQLLHMNKSATAHLAPRKSDVSDLRQYY
jgi:hypothetical protein